MAYISKYVVWLNQSAMNVIKLLSQFNHLSLPDKSFSINDDSLLMNMENTAEYDSNCVSDVTMSQSVLGISVRISQDGCACCFQLFTISTESSSFLVCLLCHFSSPSCHRSPASCWQSPAHLQHLHLSAFTQLASLWQNVEPCGFVFVIFTSFLVSFSFFLSLLQLQAL